MKKRLTVVVVAMLAIGASIGTASASAATEFGSGCAAGTYFSVGEISTSHGSTSPLPLAAPMNGVITEWKVNVGSLELLEEEPPPPLYQELYVLQSAGPNHYKVVGKADSGFVAINTVNAWPTRVPVQKGDLLGLGGGHTLACEAPESTDVTVDFRGLPPVGEVIETGKPYEKFQVPVTAKIEPDVDSDGYGDETQDKCPQSAAYQGPCPTVTINALPIIEGKAVTVHVAASISTPVEVTATVPLGKGKSATLKAANQVVGPGALAAFALKLTPKIEKAVAAKGTLTMKITASATNVTGAPSTANSTIRLGADAGPVHHRKKKKKK
jgi:hypothetical protein